ncbi:MAG: cation:proton antiporter [Microthrixaceae bacterium]
MSQTAAQALFIIMLAAVLAPVLSELLRTWRIPSVLFELLLGILVGPAILGWVEVDQFVGGLSQLGLAMLFFIAGYEINFGKLKGTPIKLGALGWVITVTLALGIGLALAAAEVVISSLLIGLALTTTAIGTLMPMLRDRGLLHSSFGSYIIAAGAIGEFGPIVAITVLLGSSSPALEIVLLAVFAIIAVGAAFVASRPQPPAFIELMRRHLTSSSKLPVRVLMMLLVGLVLLATTLGLDNLLGAFAAGIIAKIALSPEQESALEPSIEAIGFGFLVPIFFVVSGVKFDLDSLLSSPSNLLKVPVFLLLLLLIRGLPALFLYRKVLTLRQRSALALLQATALPLLVVITQIGLETGSMRPGNAAALVGAGMLSVLIFPLLGFAVLGNAEDVEGSEPAGPQAHNPAPPGESEALGPMGSL